MTHVVSFLQSALSFVVVLGILVFVHEFGHFVVAKWFGIGAPVFSLGFGPRLWGFTRNGTDYRIAAVPLGGYVRLAGDEADEHRTGAADEFLSRPRWQRFLVYVAGATFNLVLAIAVMTAVYRIWGKDEVKPLTTPPMIASIDAGSPAEAAGFKVGDKVVSIAGKDARALDTQVEEIFLSPDQTKSVAIDRDGSRLTLTLATGHVTPAEAFLIMREARKRGVQRMIVTHPLLGLGGAMTVEQMQEAAKLGAYIEVTAGTLSREGPGQARAFEAIRKVGPAMCFVSSDSGLPGNNHPDALALAAKALRAAGFTEKELNMMFKENPAKLIKLPVL